jgi:Ca-activated chloride channel family protein
MSITRIRRATAAAAAAVTVALSLAACSSGLSDDDAAIADPDTVQILAGSEIQDMAPVLEAAARETGVKVHFTYTGTLDGAQSVASGAADRRYDAVWFPSNRYLTLLPGAKDKLASSTKIMQSPVILGVKDKVAAKLGWDKKAPTWGAIAEAASKGDFRYGMTSPAASNSGFSALVAVVTAMANTGNSLTTADITKATPALKSFFSGQKLTAGSSGWLSSKVLRDPDQVDGVINYESVLLSGNKSGQGGHLKLVTPADGVITADYPFSVLNTAAPAKKTKAAALADWLSKPSSQQQIADTTYRRPAVPGVALPASFSKTPLVEQPFPNTAAVTNQLIESYLNTIRRPAQTVFSLDTSGSMAGKRLLGLKGALKNLAGTDTSTTGTFAAFKSREQVTLIPFSDSIGNISRFNVPEKNQASELAKISGAADDLQAGGGTAIYDSLIAAYKEALSQSSANPDTFTSIVLMTDGENTSGAGFEQFQSYYNGLGKQARNIPVFVINYGEGDPTELQAVASLTGGKAFDARKSHLSAVFKEIRGYQ